MAERRSKRDTIQLIRSLGFTDLLPPKMGRVLYLERPPFDLIMVRKVDPTTWEIIHKDRLCA